MLAWAGALPVAEALASGLALAAAAWLGRGTTGVRRWAWQLLLVPPAYVLTLTTDPTQRLMLFQVLLAVAVAFAFPLPQGWGEKAGTAALAAAVPLLSALPTLFAKFGWQAGWTLAFPLASALAPSPARLTAVLSGWGLASPEHPGVAVGWLLGWAFSRRLPSRGFSALERWFVPLAALGFAGSLFLPYGGLLAFPGVSLSPGRGALLVGLAVATAFLPENLAALAWTLGVWAAFAPQPVPPDRPGPTLTAASPEATLPPGVRGTLYTLELSLAHAGPLSTGTPVATLAIGTETLTLRVGRDACEWAILRGDVASQRRHGTPPTPIFRPALDAPWAVGGQVELFVPPGVTPRIVRDPRLPPEVTVAVLQAGPQTPTPKRQLPAPRLLSLALLAATLALPWLRTHPWGPWPLALLAFGRVTLSLPLEPLRILAERHGVDLALASFLAIWALAFGRKLMTRPTMPRALALLVPLALVAPQLSQLMGDEPYAVAIAESLVRDGDLDVRNNVDTERYPQWVVELSQEAGERFLHSPLLGILLAPGYLLSGRTGMVVGISLLAWLALVATSRRARELGFSARTVSFGVFVLLATYPFLLFATELWVEMPAVAAVSWQLLWAGGGRWAASALVAVLAVVAKTRLGLVTVPLAGAALLAKARHRKVWLAAALGTGVVAALALAAAALWFGNPLDPLGRRALSHLIPATLGQPLRVVFGLAFDGAYGLTFAAPLWLVAVAGFPRVWRQGGAGERALLLGAGATLAALLSYVEWRGGGSPPFRYLVPLVPVFFLGLLGAWTFPSGRALSVLLLPPSLVVGWVALTRPPMLYNIGDGGQWLADRLAERFAADARHFFPSYLRLSPAAWVVPGVVAGGMAFLWWLFQLRPGWRRWVVREACGLWLVAASALVAALHLWPDRVVELEDPQVEHRGGVLEPHPGAWSRFLYPNGWRLFSGDSVVVPLNVTVARDVVLAGWVEGGEGEVCYAYDGAAPACLRVGPGFGEVRLPAPNPGRHRLAIFPRLPEGSSVVLDKLEVRE